MYIFSFCFCLFMIEKIVIHNHNCMGNIEEGYDSLHTRYCNMWASRPVLETKTLLFMVCLSSSLSLPLYLSACTFIPPFTRVTLYLHYHILLFTLSTSLFTFFEISDTLCEYFFFLIFLRFRSHSAIHPQLAVSFSSSLSFTPNFVSHSLIWNDETALWRGQIRHHGGTIVKSIKGVIFMCKREKEIDVGYLQYGVTFERVEHPMDSAKRLL